MEPMDCTDQERVQELAVDLFDLGFNCAEASLAALGCAPGWSLPEGACGAMGFGAGMARLGFTCGCLTGSAMAMGMLGGPREPEEGQRKEAVYAAVDALMAGFQERFGSTQCRTLTGLDFQDPQARARFAGEVQPLCREFLKGAIALALEHHGQVSPKEGRSLPRLRLAQGTLDDAIARFLLKEYAASLPFSLEFQDFNHELEELPVKYHGPGGALLLAHLDDQLAGCVALRTLEPGMGEVKRLYVRPRHRGHGLGRALTEAILEEAKSLGLTVVRLDTVPSMGAAQGLYRALGFQEIPPYRPNPVPGALFMEKRLDSLA